MVQTGTNYGTINGKRKIWKSPPVNKCGTGETFPRHLRGNIDFSPGNVMILILKCSVQIIVQFMVKFFLEI